MRWQRILAEQTAGWATLVVVTWWWLGLQESSWFWALISLCAVVLVIAGAALLAVRARRMVFSGEPRSLSRTAVGVIVFAASLALGYLLINWVPKIEGLAGQLASVILRFGLAYLLVLFAWLNLLRVTSAGTPRSIQESTAPAP